MPVSSHMSRFSERVNIGHRRDDRLPELEVGSEHFLRSLEMREVTYSGKLDDIALVRNDLAETADEMGTGHRILRSVNEAKGVVHRNQRLYPPFPILLTLGHVTDEAMCNLFPIVVSKKVQIVF